MYILDVDTLKRCTMQTKIQKWGNSYAVRLPKQFVVELGLKTGNTIQIQRQVSGFLLKKIPQKGSVTTKDWKKYLIPMKSKKIIHASDRVDEIVYGIADR